MKNIYLWIILATSIIACSEKQVEESAQQAPQQKEGDESFNRQMKNLAQDYFEMRPLIASYFGVTDEDAGIGAMSRIGDFSPQGEVNKRDRLESLLAKLKVIDKRNLTSSQQVSLDLIITEMNSALEPARIVPYGSVIGEYGTWFLPYSVSHLSGLHVDFPSFMEDKHAVTNADEADAFIARLKAYPSAMDGLIEKLTHDYNLGVIPPDFIITKTLKNLQFQVAYSPEKHPMINSFRKKLAAVGIPDSASRLAQAIKEVSTGYYPATKKLMDTLTAALNKAEHTAGIHRLPNGKDLYQAMITHLSDTKMTAKQVHELGLSEVSRISSEMDILLIELGYTEGTVGSRMQKLLNDPKYSYPNTDKGKAQLIADIHADLELVDVKLKDWFGRLPNQEVAIKIVPEHQAASTSGAYYDGPSQDGKRKGTFWIALNDTSALPSYSLQTLTYHETNPGHHLQTILGLSDDLPILTNIFYSNATGEGWALYAERLAAEMGIYENDIVDDIGRLQAELHRAVRLVVDSGMHAFGWSREKAINYSIKTEGIHLSEATAEIERYSVWPGQALGYKLGELKIRALREEAQKVLGNQFDIREFHDQLLEQGALPLNLLEAKSQKWLKAKQELIH